MNNNSERIDRYLQQEMAQDERTAFEAALLADRDLQYELKIQKEITDAAYGAGLKLQFAKQISTKMLFKKVLIAGVVVVVLIATALIWYVSAKRTTGDTSLASANTTAFIHPALPGIDVPYEQYSFDAETGDTLFTATGAVIYFPPSALVNAAGNLIKGQVQVTYREFSDPIDFFLSGIPMGYDSAGVKYDFESSGMCELNAYQNKKPVFVNPAAKPEIFLSANNGDPRHNLYFLDTVNRKWVFTGKDRITVKRKRGLDSATVYADANWDAMLNSGDSLTPENAGDYGGDFLNETSVPVVSDKKQSSVIPLRPIKASDDHQSFSIAVEDYAFAELQSYNNMKFEVVDEKTYNSADAQEHWDDVKLDRTEKVGIYDITFTNSSRKVKYKVRPVLEGADYDAAMKVFNEKTKEHDATLTGRLTNEKKQQDSINKLIQKMKGEVKAQEAENAKIIAKNKAGRIRIDSIAKAEERIQLLMAERDRRMIAEWKVKDEEMRKQLLADEKAQHEVQQRDYERLSTYQREIILNNNVVRSFQVSGFGVWNCDHPQYPEKEINIYASFTDLSNNALRFSSVSVIYKGFNGIVNFPSPAGEQIRVMPGEQNMMLAAQDSVLYYFTYDDFNVSGIKSNAKSVVFRLRKAKKPVWNYEGVKAFILELDKPIAAADKPALP